MKKIYENRWKFYIVTLVLIAVGVASIFINGISLDIQFQGGAILKYTYDGDLDLGAVEKAAKEALGGREVTAQRTEDLDGATQKLVLNLAGNDGLSASDESVLENALNEKFESANIKISESSIVEPFIGKKFLIQSIKALLLSAIIIILYVWYRFRKISGMSIGVFSVLALIHDAAMVFFTFVVLRMPLNDSFIAAALTIIGLSINNTIVIYDRVRENSRLYGTKLTPAELIDKSISQSFTRSFNTSITTAASLLIVFIFAQIKGINSITTFALPMLVGIICGTWSSLFLVCPLWSSWTNRKSKKSAKA